MGKVKGSKVSGLKPKKKCCCSKKRYLTCPVVVMRMKRGESAGMKGKELQKALENARAA